jgi:hypothetical protein
MNPRLLSIPLLALTALAAGCNQYMIREGVWELSMQAKIAGTQEPVPIPKRLVRVTMGINQDGEGKDEIAKITPLEGGSPDGKAATEPSSDIADPAAELKPMYAAVTRKIEGEDPLVQIDHGDAFWRWRMWGRVQDSENIRGVHFGARHKTEYIVLEGQWGMRWIRDL